MYDSTYIKYQNRPKEQNVFRIICVFGETAKKSKKFWIVVHSEGRGECNQEASRVLVCFFILEDVFYDMHTL